MGIRNNHWYNLNEQRNYPIDDTASCMSDTEQRLPSTIIQDIRIRWPIQYGKYAFVSAVSATPHIVTVMIEVATTLDNLARDSTLIAGITIPRAELLPGQALTLQAFRNYVGGFISFGNFADLDFSGAFSTPLQSLLTARAARYVRTPPIPSIGVENAATALRGVVNFTGVAPMQLVKEARIINGVEYENVIVFKLAQPTLEFDQETTTVDSVFSEFAGDCGKRVGARSCDDPQPIESINGVRPDCDGVLTIEFSGCAIVGRNTADCGVIVDCSLGLSASCAPPYLPALADGKLPSEAPPILTPPPLLPEPPITPDVSVSDSVTTVLALPYCDTFDEGQAFSFTPIGNSIFGIIGDDSPDESFCCIDSEEQYACSQSFSESVDYLVSFSFSESTSLSESYSVSESASESLSFSGDQVLAETVNVNKKQRRYRKAFKDVGVNTEWYISKWYDLGTSNIASSYGAIGTNAETRTNVSLFNGDVQTLFRRYSTDLKIITSSLGGLRNAGLLVNYRVLATGIPSYYVALVDVDNAKFGLYFFNGIQLIVISEVQVLELRTNDWYRVTLSVIPTSSLTQINFVATLAGVTDSGVSATINAVISASSWSGDSGKSGFYAKRSQSYFSYWRIDEITA